MKTSLDHLPEGKRAELSRTLEVLFREFDDVTKRKTAARLQGRILKVILFGSYARGDWVDDPVGGYGVHNTILDNCFVYTAFSALDPLTQDKVSRLTGTVAETRTSRSAPAVLAAGRSTVLRSEIDRPLLEPGEIRALPDDEQLVFVAGRRPLRTRKLKYDAREPFRRRAAIPPPDTGAAVDAPGPAQHPWAGRRTLGEDPSAVLPRFKEAAAAIDDKKAAERVAGLYQRAAEDMAAQDAVLDHLQGRAHGAS